MDIELCLIKSHLKHKRSVFWIEKGIEPFFNPLKNLLDREKFFLQFVGFDAQQIVNK